MSRKGFTPEDVINDVRESLTTAPPAPPPNPDTLGSPPKPTIGETYSGSLDDAATLLLNIITPSIRDYAIELADITLKIPRWQLLLGSLMAQQESGTLASPSIDPSWRQLEIAMGKSICPECHTEFTPKRHLQKFCSNPCGLKAQRREIDARNKEKERINKLEREMHRGRGANPPEFREEKLMEI